ncbi:hypothetical protein DFP72DRAFT_176318 [Ephemerocybe angulata]|uniref:SAP domain-containing protein n=1 Tax=Ephemerocybe angulata TaxID=980116 RepID=A0A8H6M7C9_9AGAR|nr:hypothetical protein DFP72DRAFT_176318 [Tulosesus angulatus]
MSRLASSSQTEVPEGQRYRLVEADAAAQGQVRRHGDSNDDEESPLPKVLYATLKDRKLKDLLAEHNLSVLGERSTLEQRHQKWVMLYNANIDRSKKQLGRGADPESRPRTAAEVQRRMEEDAEMGSAALLLLLPPFNCSWSQRSPSKLAD